ncbi:MAG: hypothetical protein NTX52_09290 [Planctomycetota bacterium]|nr:hypothetical protein [Planctomycetota bacterium]
MRYRRNSRPLPEYGRGIVSDEITEGLDGDDGAGDGIILGDHRMEKDLQGIPCRAA